MDVTRNRLILLATLGSVGLLGGAFAFQYIGGLAPCQLCLWQRWPHAAAILIGALALIVTRGTIARILPLLGALAALAVQVGADLLSARLALIRPRSPPGGYAQKIDSPRLKDA